MTVSERNSALDVTRRPTDSQVADDLADSQVAQRLRRSRDFAAVMRHGRRTREPMLHLTARPNELPYSRVGYAVSRRVGGAVVRNRVKRRLRAIVHDLPIRPGYDIVAVPQPLSVNASFRELASAFETGAHRLKVLAHQNEPAA